VPARSRRWWLQASDPRSSYRSLGRHHGRRIPVAPAGSKWRDTEQEQGERRQVGPQKVPRRRPSLGVGDGAASRSKVGRNKANYTHLPLASA
jgi:hypothetical protein